MEENKDSLGKFSKTYPPLERQQKIKVIAKKEDYIAMSEANRTSRTPRFKITTAKGVSYGCSYAHLIEWIFTPPDSLSITTASRIFLIEGKNLESIEQKLMEERVKELIEFNAEKYNNAPAEGAIIIENITIEQQI